MLLRLWAQKEGINYNTAWRWFKAGKLPFPSTKTPSGTLLIHPPEENRSAVNARTVIYARVSSSDKKADLLRQVDFCKEFCRAKGWEVSECYSEIASGMNDKRPRLHKMLDSKPGRLVVAHKDRLTRFGFRYFEKLLPMIGCELVVVDRDSEEKADLMKDMIAILYSFSARIYGLRRGRQLGQEAKKVLCKEPAK